MLHGIKPRLVATRGPSASWIGDTLLARDRAERELVLKQAAASGELLPALRQLLADARLRDRFDGGDRYQRLTQRLSEVEPARKAAATTVPGEPVLTEREWKAQMGY